MVKAVKAVKNTLSHVKPKKVNLVLNYQTTTNLNPIIELENGKH